MMAAVRGELPSGTVTFLFTDVEGSTRLLHELGEAGYARALAEHRRVIREVVARHGGVEVDTQGDSFFIAFSMATDALAAAADALEELAAGLIRVRMGVHTGTPYKAHEGYVGVDVHRAARIGGCGHGGQVLVSASTAALLGTEGLRDLGEHRLKDFDEPVGLYQLGEKSFAPLRTISNTNLPRPASSFVGREREVEEVASLLQAGARLLTLTGPGGAGKTRLAIETAATLVQDFKAGVFWVGLAALRDSSLVSDTIAQALGARIGLADHIAERELLLLLDNFEHVVEAAPELATLVETCPNLKLLVTSRELLRVSGEVEYLVPPLADLEAVELFCARARTDPGQTIEDLCRALDNLPLALELAAARTSVLSPRQVLERLSERLDLLRGGRAADPRQQTLRATIEWSYELLAPEEQRLFGRLSVFTGGCTLAAAEEVAEAELDILQSLVDKSLVRHAGERFWMLETIREYATERLEESSQAEELWRRHAAHFLALTEKAEPRLYEEMLGGGREWLDLLERELDNLRGALDRLALWDEGERAQRLAGAAAEFWCKREHWAEGRRYLENALRRDDRPTAARAKALIGAAHMARDTGDVSTARLRAEEGLAIYRILGDLWGTANALFWVGQAAAEVDDVAMARQSLAESARLFGEVGDERYALLAKWVSEEFDPPDRARAHQEDNLQRARALGSRPLEATVLSGLASRAIDDRRIDDARSLARESLCLHRDLDDRAGIVQDLCRCAGALALAGAASTAAVVLSGAEALFEEIGWSVPPYLAAENKKTLTSLRCQLTESALAGAWERGRTLTASEAIALALNTPE